MPWNLSPPVTESRAAASRCPAPRMLMPSRPPARIRGQLVLVCAEGSRAPLQRLPDLGQYVGRRGPSIPEVPLSEAEMTWGRQLLGVPEADPYDG